MVGIHDRSPRFTFMNRATDGFTLRRWRDRAPKYHSTVPRSTRLREYPPSEKRICLTAPDSARYPWDHSRQQNQIGCSDALIHAFDGVRGDHAHKERSEAHTSEIQSLTRTSSDVSGVHTPNPHSHIS